MADEKEPEGTNSNSEHESSDTGKDTKAKRQPPQRGKTFGSTGQEKRG